VPNHAELAKGTLRALIREAGLTKEQFVALLSRRSHFNTEPSPPAGCTARTPFAVNVDRPLGGLPV